jgi:hypothetical protein
MAKQLHAQIDIHASRERVWEVLTDFAAYPQWNPFISQAQGTARAGERLTNRMQPVGGRAVTLKPTVLQATPGQQLRWVGRVLAPGIFDAEHTFTIARAAFAFAHGRWRRLHTFGLFSGLSRSARKTLPETAMRPTWCWRCVGGLGRNDPVPWA